jgi:hypothetical protein
MFRWTQLQLETKNPMLILCDRICIKCTKLISIIAKIRVSDMDT